MPVDVKKLAAQLDAAQAILDEIRISSGCSTFAPRYAMSPSRMETALETAIRAREERRNRTVFVGTEELFGEPAWDMLLDLFILQTNEEEISVKSLCSDTSAVTATIMRWIGVLEHSGLIQSMDDPQSETKFIHLTATGYEGMLRYLGSIARQHPDD